MTTELAPSEPATVSGVYALITERGGRTCVTVPVFAGSAVPVAPVGWRWRLVDRTLPPD